jgi:LCP family protein required for cell wall assembly
VDERAQDEDEPDSAVPETEPASPPPAPRRGRFRGISLNAGRTLAAVISVGILGTMGYGWWAFGDVDQGTVTTDVIDPGVASPDDHHVPLDGAVDILLVGMDSRTDAYGNPLPKAVMDLLHAGINDGERNTDTMILVHIPVDGKRAVAISFPRDSWVDIGPGFGKHKLNSAFAYAYNDARGTLSKTVKDAKELEAQAAAIGRKNLIAAIENLIGHAVSIDRYAEVNLASFYEVTNAIGGVEVCLNAPVSEPKSGANFPAGPQTISGAQALSFVRQRYGLPNGDLDRIVRQQVFLGALANKVLSADMLTSPSKARDLIAAVQKSVVLSKGWELSTFAAQMAGLSAGAIDFYTIPTEGGAKIGGADVIKVDPEQVHAFVAGLTGDDASAADRHTDDPTVVTPSSTGPTTTTTTDTVPVPPSDTDTAAPPALPPGQITVDVRNASRTKGLAGLVENRLVQQGFRQGTIGDVAQQSVSVVQYASGEQYNAQLVANSLGQQLALEPDLSLPAGHVRVILATDFPTELPQGFRAGAFHLAQPTTSSAPPTAGTTMPPPIVAGRLTCVN